MDIHFEMTILKAHVFFFVIPSVYNLYTLEWNAIFQVHCVGMRRMQMWKLLSYTGLA